MKVRSGFVSNSSSSSFVVIGTGSSEANAVKPYIGPDGELEIGERGETEFGWGPEVIRSVFSRINFAVLQAESADNNDWIDMISDVIKEETGAESVVFQVDGYIDHQSAAREGENTQIFDDEDALRAFMFCEDSKIVLDNDNRF